MAFIVWVKFKSGRVETFRNVTEIHYNYLTPLEGVRIAIESDIEGQGYTYLFSDIFEFEAVIQEE